MRPNRRDQLQVPSLPIGPGRDRYSRRARKALLVILGGAFAVAIAVGVILAKGSSTTPVRSVTIPLADRTASPALLRAAEAVRFREPSTSGLGSIEDGPITTDQAGDSGGLLPVGAVAPSFTLRTPAGEPLSLVSLRGKTVLLEFFATWCPHCAAEARHLKKLYRSLPRARYAFVSVNADGEDAASVLAYHIWFDFPFPALLDPSDRPGTFHKPGSAGPVSKSYRVAWFPTFYVLDPAGRIAWRAHGEQPDALLLRELRRAS